MQQDTKHLRDLFAGLAMQAMISNPKQHPQAPEDVSETAYRYANAMLKEREKQP